MKIETRRLDPRDLQDRNIIFQYESPGHYRVDIQENAEGWTINLKREDFGETFRKREREKVISPYKGNSEIHAAYVDGHEVGLVQFEFQEYNKSVRIWDIDVAQDSRRKGVGKALMGLCLSRSRELGARRIVLETQTSNLKAIAFYRTMGFELIGLDAGHYTNEDVGRGEVRLEMAICLGIPK
jgi:ribosomal protein S18 acetylase RimI-like enzyme